MSVKRDHSDDEEEDYMSEAFLSSLQKKDVRPGLQFNKSEQRKFEIEKKRKLIQVKPRYEIEKEKREAGLSTSLDASNKGFQMFQKMAKFSSAAETTAKMKQIEPIKTELKPDRLGLGIKIKMKERNAAASSSLERIEENYKRDVRAKLERNIQLVDLKKCQSCCYQLDCGSDVQGPKERWYWPKSARPPLQSKEEEQTHDDCDDGESELEVEDPEEGLELIDSAEKLIELNALLRSTYNFCVWCGVKYESAQDIADNCPGETRTIHDDE